MAPIITKTEDAKILITKNGEVCPNTIQAVRDISEKVGFKVDPAWNTQTAGAKLIKFLLTDLVSKTTEEIDAVQSDVQDLKISSQPQQQNKKSFYGESLMDWLKEVCIIESDDEVYYDAESSDEEEVELFINNLKTQNDSQENELLEELSFKTAEDFISYLDEDEDGLCLAQKIISAAYCTSMGIEIDDDTELYVDEQLYYFNDSCDFHYEYSTDIDLG